MSFSARTKTAVAALAALALAASAGVAWGVTVYSNDFSNKAKYEEIMRSGGGKACDRRYRDKQKAMLTSVKKGPLTCSYRAPVEGDSELPDHELAVEAKVLKSTPKAARGGAFAELTLRAGGGGVGYSLRVFPEKGRFELIRQPAGGGDFPARGESKAIKGINKRNRISLVADGARVVARVNGKELASVTDGDPGQVTGRKVRFGIGSAKKTQKDVAAVIRQVTVGVP
jgi:hypothetical protein